MPRRPSATPTSQTPSRVRRPRRRWPGRISRASFPATVPYEWTGATWALGEGYRAAPASRFHVVAYDFGVKHNILRMLAERGCRLTVVPAQTHRAAVLALEPDGVFLSNGPGDPEPCTYAIDAIRDARRRRPADVRHLPRPSAARARVGRPHAQDEVRPSRREPSGARPGHGPGADHEPEPRLRRRSGIAADQRARHARVAVRRQPAGDRAHRPAGVRLPGPSRGEPGPARRPLPVRPLRAS